MTLHPQHEFSIPEETIRVARAAYPKGNLSMKMRDALGTIDQDESFSHLFPQNGRPVEAPWRLAFITIVQFLEELASSTKGGAEQMLLDTMLALFKERGRDLRNDSHNARTPLTSRGMHPGSQSTDVRGRSYAVCPRASWLLWLAIGCLRTPRKNGWTARGIGLKQTVCQKAGPNAKSSQKPLVGMALCFWELFSMRQLRSGCVRSQLWIFCVASGCRITGMRMGNCTGGASRISHPQPVLWVRPTIVRHATAKSGAPAFRGIEGPFDRNEAQKDSPHLLTHVATTAAPHADDAMGEPIHADLERAHLLPGQHFLDSGSVTAKTLASSQKEYGIEMIGPTKADYKWQASVFQGFDASHFTIDWQAKQAHWTARAYEQKLDSCSRQSGPRGHQNPFLDQGLPSLSEPTPVYSIALQSPSSVVTSPSTRAIPGFTSRAPATNHKNLCETIRASFRDRSDDVSRGPHFWHAPLALYWLGQDPSPAYRDGCRDQSRPRRSLAGWR